MNRSEFWLDLSEVASAADAQPQDMIDLFVEFVVAHIVELDRVDLDDCASLLIGSNAWKTRHEAAVEHLWSLFTVADRYERDTILFLGLLAYHDQGKLLNLVESGFLSLASVVNVMWLFRYTEPEVCGLYMDILCALGRARWCKDEVARISPSVILFLFTQGCDDDSDLKETSLLLLLVLSDQFESSGLTNEVLSVLGTHKKRFRSLGASLVMLWNRSTSKTIDILVSRFMAQAFSCPQTSDFLYTNDLIVFVEILLRDLSETESEVTTCYLRVLYVLLHNTTLRQCFADLKSTIVHTLRLAMERTSPKDAEIASGCLQIRWLGWASPSLYPSASPGGKSSSPAFSDDSEYEDEIRIPPAPRPHPPVPLPRGSTIRKAPPPPPPSRYSLSNGRWQ